MKTFFPLISLSICRKDNVMRLWNYLLELLRARRMRLEMSLSLQKVFREMLYILDWMDEIKARLLSEDFGKHLMGVEDLIQKHSLLESDINVVGERVRAVNNNARTFVEEDDPEAQGIVTNDSILASVWRNKNVFVFYIKFTITHCGLVTIWQHGSGSTLACR